MTALDIELTVVHHFGVRGGMKQSRMMIVPNFIGMYLHECDLFCVTGAGWAWEVEIKVSLSDLLADAKKHHRHESGIIQKLWFAMPESLRHESEHVPARAGIMLAQDDGRVVVSRNPQDNRNARKLTPDEIINIGRLASQRIWSLKRKLKGAD
jgi:hypothetical protein